MVYKLHKNGSFNIHTIKTDRFKNIQMEILFRNNLDEKNVHKRVVLFDTLMASSKEYKTKRDIALKLEDLYNASCYARTTKIGGEVVSSITLDFLNPKYAEEEYLSEVIKLPFDLIFSPDVTNNEFASIPLESVKCQVISDIKNTKENPKKLSIQKALEKAVPKSISSIPLTGKESDILSITPANLFEEYTNILKHDYIDIFVIGDIDVDKMISEIVKYAAFNTIKTHEIEMNVLNAPRKKAQEIEEKSDFSQSQLVYILNTLNLTEEEKRYPFIIYNLILGGGSLETKLYGHLRDEHSLCYNVLSLFQKYDNLEIIQTGIDYKNMNLAKKLIKETLHEMENSVTDDEVNRAILAVISAINISLDRPEKIIDQYFFEYLGSIEPMDVRIEKFKKVTKEEVMKIAKKVKLNTIYVLKGGEKHEN